MRPRHLISVTVLALAAACSDTATSPTSVDPPQFVVATGPYPGTLNTGAVPAGGHLQSGNILCTVNSSFGVTCSGYQINGIGNTNATATLNASYSATVDCTNNGGKLVPVKSTVQNATVTSGQLAPKNGALVVPSISTGGQTPTLAQFTAAATCPNGNWTKSVEGGSITLESFSYTLTFVGFTTPAVSISAS